MHWPKGSLFGSGNVIGDELYAESMCKALLSLGVESCELYSPNYLPSSYLDVMIYLNDVAPRKEWAKIHVIYVQNSYSEGSEIALKRFQKRRYEGYAFISKKLFELHRDSGMDGIWLPFGVDTDFFQPKTGGEKYLCDVSYVGNDIKGEKRTLQFIYPATNFDFALYGNWSISIKNKILFWRIKPYRRRLARLCRGKIPQEDIPLLYSQSKVNINCSLQDSINWDVITLRTLEVLSCRGFLISDRIPSAEGELENGIIFTDGHDDLSDKIRYYLERPDERIRISENGYEYVKKNATIEMRMSSILKYLKKKL